MRRTLFGGGLIEGDAGVIGHRFFVGPINTSAETVVGDTAPQGPSTNITAYINVQGDTGYNGATVRIYGYIDGTKILFSSATSTLPNPADSATHDFSMHGEACDYFEVSIQPTGATATKQAIVALIAYGKEASGAAIGQATSTTVGGIQLTDDLGGTATAPDVVQLTGPSNGSSPMPIITSTFRWLESDTSPIALQQAQAVTNTAGADFQVRSQAAKAGGGGKGGDLLCILGLSDGSTPQTHFFKVQLETVALGAATDLLSLDENGSLTLTTPNIQVNLGKSINSLARSCLYFGLTGDTQFTTSNYAIQGSTTDTWINSPGNGSAIHFMIHNGSDTLTGDLVQLTAAAYTWGINVPGPSFTQTQQAAAAAPNSMTIAPQAPSGSATNATNGTPGSLIVNLAAIVNGGSEGEFDVERAGTVVARCSAIPGVGTGCNLTLGNNANDNAHYTVQTDGSSYVAFNLPSGSATGYFRVTNSTQFFFTNAGVQFGGTNTAAFGGGSGVVSFANAGTAPTTNPANAYVVYAAGGALKGRGASGTVTTIGPAELDGFGGHCPACGSDFAVEWQSDEYGLTTVCMRCLADELGPRPWIVQRRKAA